MRQFSELEARLGAELKRRLGHILADPMCKSEGAAA